MDYFWNFTFSIFRTRLIMIAEIVESKTTGKQGLLWLWVFSTCSCHFPITKTRGSNLTLPASSFRFSCSLPPLLPLLSGLDFIPPFWVAIYMLEYNLGYM
jgi:hypothetical protein